MASRAQLIRPPHAALLLCAIAVALLGLALATRLGYQGRLDLLAISAIALAGSVIFTRTFIPQRQVLAMCAIAAAAALCLFESITIARPTYILTLIWLLILLGVGLRSGETRSLAAGTIVSAPAMSVAFPFLTRFVDPPFPATPVQALSAATACFTIATSFCIVQQRLARSPLAGGTRDPRYLARIPVSLLWLVSGILAMMASISLDRVWTVLTIFAASGAFLASPSAHEDDSRSHIAVFPSRTLVIAAGASLLIAPLLGITAAFAGYPFGWPVASAAAVALLAIVTLMRAAAGEMTTMISLLHRSALESRVDALTGLTNRRGLDEQLELETARAIRFGHPLSLLLIDIDDFKSINDRYGHAEGDIALQTVARAIASSVRSIDIAARFGGEEFAVILPETALQGAVVVAERIRNAVTQRNSDYDLSVSVGVAERWGEENNYSLLLSRADAGLYRAKSLGKNRVELG